MEAQFKIYIVQAGDRIDTIAHKVYGNSLLYPKLITDNSTLDIFAPQPGLKIKVRDE